MSNAQASAVRRLGSLEIEYLLLGVWVPILSDDLNGIEKGEISITGSA
jgi:hypothetical protein